jgi:hypothetical protein
MKRAIKDATGEEVLAQQIDKCYEVAKDQYVLFTRGHPRHEHEISGVTREQALGELHPFFFAQHIRSQPSGDAGQHIAAFQPFHVRGTVIAEMSDMLALGMMLLLRLRVGPMLHKHKTAWIIAVNKKIILQAAFLHSGRLNDRNQVAAQLLLPALLGIQHGDHEQLSHHRALIF